MVFSNRIKMSKLGETLNVFRNNLGIKVNVKRTKNSIKSAILKEVIAIRNF